MNIYVANLSYDAAEEDLKNIFGEFGKVDSVNIIKDKYTGKSRGFGFVEMPSDEESKKAIDELQGKDFQGRPLSVNEARPRKERAPRNDSFNRDFE
ncbi:RNA-binding protein [hydrothermal vent metagenome]|uniref:RNA-binding protein n=1 Tax=hydrothermal vent metagenome TaxID=652676 RepID=A0A3B1DRZ8_9ZZZZ